MRRKRNINALSIAIWVFVLSAFVCVVLFVLQDKFGLLTGDVQRNRDYTIEISIKNDENANKPITLSEGKNIYLFGTRESLGEVVQYTYDEDGTIITLKVRGFYKDDLFYLNGKTVINADESIRIMNNEIVAYITKI